MAKEDDRRTGVRVGDPPMRGVNPELLRLREAIERLEGSLIDINNGLSKPEVTVERYAKRGIIIRTLLMIPTTLIMCGALLTTYGSAGFKWLALIFVGYIGCSLYSVMREHRLPIKPKEPLEKNGRHPFGGRLLRFIHGNVDLLFGVVLSRTCPFSLRIPFAPYLLPHHAHRAYKLEASLVGTKDTQAE
jgi:hypothetical protein